jgi:hypothetical protein
MPSSPPSTGDPVASLALTAVASGGVGLEVAVEATTGCATVFVYLTTYDQSTSAALTRISATSLSLVLCLLYLLLSPFHPLGLIALIGIGTLALTVIGRSEDVVTAGSQLPSCSSWRLSAPTTRGSSRFCASPTRRLGSSSASLPRGRLCDSSAKHRSASLLRVRPEGSPRSTSSLRHPGRGLIPTRGSRATSVGGAPTLSLSNVIDERRQCPRAGSHRQADKPLVTREPRDHLPSWGGDPSADRRRSIGSRSRRP